MNPKSLQLKALTNNLNSQKQNLILTPRIKPTLILKPSTILKGRTNSNRLA